MPTSSGRKQHHSASNCHSDCDLRERQGAPKPNPPSNDDQERRDERQRTGSRVPAIQGDPRSHETGRTESGGPDRNDLYRPDAPLVRAVCGRISVTRRKQSTVSGRLERQHTVRHRVTGWLRVRRLHPTPPWILLQHGPSGLHADLV